MKHTLNGQFAFSEKNLPYSESVETLNKKLALGRCHTYLIKVKMLRIIKMGLGTRQMKIK